MSRTYKDAPARIRRNRAAGTGAPVAHRCGHHWGTALPCDAASRREQHGDHRTCEPHIKGRSGKWDPRWKSAQEMSEWFRAPERAAVRLSLERARKQARSGDVDEVPPAWNHRHSPWGGGRWG